MDKTVLEIFGYVGSVLVVVSMLMSSIVKLRIINTVGSIISAIYAFISGALPLVLMNICLIVINLISLYKLLKNKKSYELVISDSDDPIVKYFIDRNYEDIKIHFPNFNKDELQGNIAYVVFCEGNAAGLSIVKKENDFTDIIIDYSTPAYRDCTVGQFLYEKFSEEGITLLRYSDKASPTHAPYLEKMGFVQKENGYEKQL